VQSKQLVTITFLSGTPSSHSCGGLS